MVLERSRIVDVAQHRAREKVFHPTFDERFELATGTPESKGRVAERVDPELLVPDGRGDHARFALALGQRLGALDATAGKALIERLEAVLEAE